jgi:hypothetical protein
MERYQHVVRFTTYGHTHTEEFYLTMDMKTQDPIGWNFISGSGTTDGGVNPCFNVIEFDKEYMVPTNVITYYMNLTEANLNPDQTPEFKVLHDYKNDYSLPDLSPSSMLEFSK